MLHTTLTCKSIVKYWNDRGSCVVPHRKINSLRRLVKCSPLVNITFLNRKWLLCCRISSRPSRLKAVGYYAIRPVERPLHTHSHKVARMQWCHWWNSAFCRNMHWSIQSGFLSHVIHSSVRLWLQPNTTKYCWSCPIWWWSSYNVIIYFMSL